jgi:hypothetical protein
MDLIDYSSAIKEVINGKPGTLAMQMLNELPLGRTKKLFGFVLGDKTIRVMAPTKDLMQPIFNILNRAMPQDFYDYTIRVSAEGKTKTLSRRGHPAVSLKRLYDEMHEVSTFERTFFEILKTNDFEVTNSEFEGTIIKSDDQALLRRVFQLLTGLFPFAEIERDTKRVGIECSFEVEKDELTKKEQKKKGTVVCDIIIDGKQVGSKSSSFFF